MDRSCLDVDILVLHTVVRKVGVLAEVKNGKGSSQDGRRGKEEESDRGGQQKGQ